jgi:hypothetical protein
MAVFGIDFGTTTSGAVQLVAGHGVTFGDGQGSPLPSIVVIDRVTGEGFGGRRAWNERFDLERALTLSSTGITTSFHRSSPISHRTSYGRPTGASGQPLT